MSVAGRSPSHADLHSKVVGEAAQVMGLVDACCGLLLLPVPTPPLFTAALESVLLQLGLHSQELGLRLINTLLGNQPNLCSSFGRQGLQHRGES